MKKVLILGVASVQMDAIILLNEMGIDTYACAKENDGPGYEVANHFDAIDFLDITKVTEHIRTNKIDAVYSVGCDSAMPVVGKISRELSLPHFVSFETAKICNNKGMMRETLGHDCKGNLNFQVIENEEDIPSLGYPYIMKPADSQGQRGVTLVSRKDDYLNNFQTARNYSRSQKVIVEKYVDGCEVSVNAYMVDNEVRFILVSDRVTWPEYTGLIHKHILPSQKVSTDTSELIRESVADGCRRIGIENGPVYFQIKVENGKPYIIEMTPRLDGCHMWKLIKYHIGVDLLKLTFEHLLFNDTSELDHVSSYANGYELEFFCQKPETMMNRSSFIVPDEALEHFFYYDTGDMIRPINGKFDKVGYHISRM